MHGYIGGLDFFFIALAFTAELDVVGVKHDFIVTLFGNAYAVVISFNIRKITYRNNLLALFVNSAESDNGIVRVVA